MKSGTVNLIIFCALCATMLLLPLPYGSVEPWSIAIFEAVTFILFGLHLAGELGTKNNKQADRFSIPLVFKIALAAFFAFTALQIVPLPRSVIAFLISGHVRTRRQIGIFVWVIMAGAVFQSLYGLAEFFGGTHRIFGWINIYYKDSVFGTFVNRNHFAGFLEMALPISIGYLLAKADFFSLRKGLSLREKILWFGQERLSKTIIHAIVPIVLGVGLFFSRSRGGLFNFFVSLFLMITAVSAATKKDRDDGKARSSRYRGIIRTVFLGIVFIALLIGIRPILARFSPEIVQGEGRPVLYKNTIGLIGHYPLFGTGPGTFVFAYPKYEKIGMSSLIDHAHNDYLELISESGFLAGGCLILSAIGMLIFLYVRWTRRRDDFVKGIALGCLAGIVAILIHSIGDFNLRIPANAVYFVSLYALALATIRLRTAQNIP